MAKNILVTVKGPAFISGGGREGNTSREIKGIMTGIAKELKKSLTEKVANEAAEAAAEIVFKRSQIYVPVKTGDLKASGTFKQTKPGLWEVSYGSDITGFYATIVHEDLTQDINRKAPVGSKYITRAAQDTQKEQQKAIEKIAKKNGEKVFKR